MCQGSPPRPSDETSIESNGISKRSNRTLVKFLAKKHKKTKCHFWTNEAERSWIRSNRNPIRKNLGTIGLISPNVAKTKNTTFGRVKPIVPGFFRIGFRIERILGRSAELAKKWHVDIFWHFFAFDCTIVRL